MRRLIQGLFATFLIAFPFGYRWLIFEDFSYRSGHFNPWVSGFIYAPEILLLITAVLWLLFSKHKNRLHKNSLVVLGLFAVNGLIITIYQGIPLLGLLLTLRFVEVYFFYQLLISAILPIQTTVICLLLGAAMQLFIGEFQYFLNHSIGLQILGESRLGPNILGVAKHNLADGAKQIRAYGTFLHPNILAAYFVCIYFVAQPYLKKYNAWILLGLTALGLLWSFSRAALMVFLIGLCLVKLFEKVRIPKRRQQLSLLVIIGALMLNMIMIWGGERIGLSDLAWQERLAQIQISKNMIKNEPLGVGISHFTLDMEGYTESKQMPWEFQPVHNTYLLILNETGIQGLILLLIGLYFYFRDQSAQNTPILPLLLILLASFDHYLYTSWAGLMLIVLAFAFPTPSRT